MKCIDINDAKILIAYFTSNEASTLSQTFTCFNEQFFEEFYHYSHKEFIQSRDFAKFREEELIRDAFNQGLMSFYVYMREKGFEQRGATIKTFFFEFCKRKLLGLLKTLQVHSGRQYQGDPDVLLATNMQEDTYSAEAFREEQKKEEEKEYLLDKALALIGERCSRLIRWRKLERMGNEDIASRTGLAENTVNSEVYKCMLRLKKIVKDLDPYA